MTAEEHISNREYETHSAKLSNPRSRIAADLPADPGMRILDLATGEAFFAIEVARCGHTLKITGIDISQRSIQDARKNLKREDLQDRVEILKLDATLGQ